MNGALGAALTAAVAAAAASDALLPALGSGLAPFALLALCAAACLGAGRALLRALGVEELDESERSAAGAALGLGALALSVFGLGALGLLRPWAGSLLLGAFWLAGWGELRAALGPGLAALREGARERPWLSALIALPLLGALWACLVPPHQYDSLVYHLAMPEAYVREGRLHAPAGVVFAHFPQNGEMLFTLALLLGSDLLAQMLTWLATALTVLLLLSMGRRLTPAAPWAAALVATHSSVLLMSSTTYVEPLVMLWVTGALLAFEASGGGERRGPLLLSAAFTGLALGTKYTAGLVAALLALRLLWRGRLKECALFTALVSALFAPWLLKNAVYAGNPVFPFLYRLFPATKVGWSAELASGYFQVLTEYGHANGFWKDLLALPVLLLRNPLRFGGGMDVLGDLGWTLVLWLWPAGVWAAWKGRGPRGLAAFTALYALGWFSTGVVLRFLTALAPGFALLGAHAALQWDERADPGARAAGRAAAGTLIAGNLFLALFVHGVFGSGSVLLALEDRERFLSRKLDYYPCAGYARTVLRDEHRVLVVGEQRGYYIGRRHLPSTVHAPNRYVTLSEQAPSSAALAASLRAEGFTHLLFVPRESERLGQGLGALTPAAAERWKGLESRLEAVYRGPACVMAALRAS